jgi:hypothetical protein
MWYWYLVNVCFQGWSKDGYWYRHVQHSRPGRKDCQVQRIHRGPCVKSISRSKLSLIPEIVLLKGKLEDVELPVKQVDIIISEVSSLSPVTKGPPDLLVDGILPSLRVHARHRPPR